MKKINGISLLHGIYYKNKKDLLERCNVVFNFIK